MRLTRATSAAVETIKKYGQALLGYILMVIGPVGLAFYLFDHRPLTESMWAKSADSLILVTVLAILLGFLVFIFRRALRQEVPRGTDVAAITIAGISAVAYVILTLWGSLTWLATRGVTITYNPPEHSLTVRDVPLKFLWEGCDAVPLLKIPETTGWKDPIPHPGVLLGMALLLFKVFLIFLIFETAKGTVKALRKRRDTRSAAKTMSRFG